MVPHTSVRPTRAWRVAALLLLSLCLVGPLSAVASTSASPDARPGSGPSTGERNAGQVAFAAAYGKLPLSFEANQGQAPAGVNFLARGGGYTLLLGANQAVLASRPPTTSPKVKQALEPGSAPWATPTDITPVTLIGLRLVDANLHSSAVGQDPLPGTVNYFLGSDPAQWQTGLPTYGAVRYGAVYPGIDLVYHGQQGQLEYDFDLAPGADPGSIRLAVEGTEQVELTAQGDLVLHTAIGDLRQPKPVLYQERDGVRLALDGGYALGDQHEVSFWVGAYDLARPFTIDPVLVYSTYLGGSGSDSGAGIAVDTAGNAYVTGSTSSTDFPTTPGVFQAIFGGGSSEAFVSKVNPAGTALVYSTYLGGSGGDSGAGIVVDAAGNAYVTGGTSSANFPTTTGAFQRTLTGPGNAFVTKLNSAGTALVYSTFLGGSGGTFPPPVVTLAVGLRLTRPATRTSREAHPRPTSPPPRAPSSQRLAVGCNTCS